jgi:hypothetical protein
MLPIIPHAYPLIEWKLTNNNYNSQIKPPLTTDSALSAVVVVVVGCGFVVVFVGESGRNMMVVECDFKLRLTVKFFFVLIYFPFLFYDGSVSMFLWFHYVFWWL